MLVPSLLVFAAIIAEPARRCSIEELRHSPNYKWRVERVGQKVDSATQIVRARAISADSAAQTITFEPLEWFRGASLAATIVLPGVAVDRDDFNPLTVPYQMVRPSGTRGDCHAREYRLGREYLLLLHDGPSRYPIYWWPLGPVNEQLRGQNDPWLKWVAARVAPRR